VTGPGPLAGRGGHVVGAAVAAALAVAGAAVGSSCTACGHGSTVDRDKSETRLKLCEDFLRNRQLEAAAKECQRSLAHHPGNERAHNTLGLIAILRALALQKVLEVDDCLTGVDAEGLRKELDGHLFAADEHFDAAVKAAADYGEAQHNRGTVALLLDDPNAAVRHFEEALANSPRLESVPVTRAGLGWAFFLQGKHPQAAAELRKAVSFQPGLCLAEYRLARVYFARKEWENALQQLEAVVAQAELCPIQEAHLYLMKTYSELGLYANLARVLESCLAIAPRSCVAAQCRSAAP
jgi:tetratricopeptide (TPR) repeat protein